MRNSESLKGALTTDKYIKVGEFTNGNSLTIIV